MPLASTSLLVVQRANDVFAHPTHSACHLLPSKQGLWRSLFGTANISLWCRHAAGVVDDLFGANFIAGNNNSMTSDHSGHGTATAQALMRAAPRVTLMPCKALTENAVVPFSVAIQCIEWCAGSYYAHMYTQSYNHDEVPASCLLRPTVSPATMAIKQIKHQAVAF